MAIDNVFDLTYVPRPVAADVALVTLGLYSATSGSSFSRLVSRHDVNE